MKKRKLGVMIGTLVLFAVISGVVTSFILFQQQKNNTQLEEKMTDVAVKEKKEKTVMSMKEILAGVDEMYLESYLGSSHIIEMDDSHRNAIVTKLKDLDLKLLMKAEEVTENIEEYNDCLYAIHIKNKNMKIKINEKYVIVEDVQGSAQLFEGDLEQLKDLNEELKSIYMGQYKTGELFEKAKNVYVEAKDEEKKWMLNETEADQLLKAINLTAPMDGKEMAAMSNLYPDYMLTIETDKKNYTIHLVNEQILTLDTSDNFVYYKYDKKLWEYIHEKYAVAFKEDTNQFKYLLKSSKIIVEDMENTWDFEDDTYYHVEIPRWLIKAKTEEVKEIPNDESLKYSMQFIIHDEMIAVKIYKNYIAYKGKFYYSEKISDIITGALVH